MVVVLLGSVDYVNCVLFEVKHTFSTILLVCVRGRALVLEEGG